MQDDPETVLGRAIRFVRQAGAPSEDTYDRDGAFSFHAESHAFGVGVGVGAFATATGEWRYVAGLLGAAFGLNRGPTLASTKITEDIVQEPHYFLFGLVIGAYLGARLL